MYIFKDCLFMNPSAVLSTLYQLVHLQAAIHNLLPIDQVILRSSRITLLYRLNNARSNMPLPQPLPCHLKINLYKPQFIKQQRSIPPHFLIQRHIVPLNNDNPVRRQHGNVILPGVFHSVIKRRRVYRFPRRKGPS